ncbi:HlyC/CorC family transporter [Marinagarivorans algicola]|uniref:HlyC/CorC family transporter n=1 Tax=Marinagarivorans algicola TaxID=1513270 RepID=UPI0009EB675A|nr:transporter associated domain-containing protein [Marinagarivorans algicola]
MSEDPPSSQSNTKDKPQERSWIDKLLNSFTNNEPQSREELLDIIKEAASNKLLDDEALEIIEGALSVSHLQVREIMIPRSQMVVIKQDETPEEFLPKIIESCHSRFPVIGDSIDDVRGILLAKDLLPLLLNREQAFTLESILRPANIIPESKRLNVLLKEFREKRYHMAIVIDEYGGISGLVTIEDILEEIVGEIEDETDDDDDDFIRRVSDDDFIVKALTPIDDFNAFFDGDIDDSDFDTIGGIVMQAFGHMPSRNEVVELKDFRFRILYADSRQIHLIRVTKLG